MHPTAQLVLQLLEEHLPQQSAEELHFYQKLQRLISDLGIEAVEWESLAALNLTNYGLN